MPVGVGERVIGDVRGHHARYRFAAGFCEPGSAVVDAACGSGYGAAILNSHGDCRYVGVDRDIEEARRVQVRGALIEADLVEWEPDFSFDVAVGFETIEHLPSFERYVEWIRRARQWIVVSCPVVPTVGANPWHLHDFEPGELAAIFEGDGWEVFQTLGQPSELAEIVVLGRP